MNAQLLILGSAVMLTLAAHAGIFTGGAFANSGYIPDGSAVGSSATATASGLDPYITGVSVTLNISGGYNGDLYAYLSYNGTLVPLLNRVGVGTGNAFGYGDSGFNVTLSSAGAYDVHNYGNYSPSFNGSGQLTGTWQPDGRAINPLGAPSTFDAAGTVNFSSYNGMNPNGTWTLFIADLSAGGQSQLTGWSLDLTASAVPEPANAALAIFAGLFLVVTLARNQQVRNRVRRCRVAFVEWVNAV
jgi:hypothetical protein